MTPGALATASLETGRSATPAPKAVMYAYPWDLYDHGVERALDELEACGIYSVQLSFSYHLATFLNPRNPRRKTRYGEPGVLEFDPGVLAAGAWPFEPPVAPEVSGVGYTSELLSAMAARGFDVIAWVVYLYNHNVAKRRPELSVENAFGDRHGAQLCPANPAVRDYAAKLTNAVMQAPHVSGMVVESLSFLPFDYGFINLKSAVTPSAGVGRLLSLCFCDHCTALALEAEIDVPELRRRVVKVIEAELAELPDGKLIGSGAEQWQQQSTALNDYLTVRRHTATSLQREALGKARGGGLRTGTNSAEGQDPRVSGVPNEAVADLRDEFRFELLPTMSAAQLGQAVQRARAAAGEGVELYALAQLSNFQTENSFRGSLETAAGLGIERFRLYEYGLLSERQLAWLRNSRDLWRT